MPKKAGPWTILSSKVVYTTPWITVHEDNVRTRNGQATTYSWIRINEGVTVIPIDENGNVYLAREYRYGPGRYTLEAMSGGMEKKSTPLQNAKRELKEELGITAKKWHYFGAFDSITSQLRHREHLFLAEGLTVGTQHLEDTEEIEIVRMSLARALKLVEMGTITTGFTALALLKTRDLLEKRARSIRSRK